MDENAMILELLKKCLNIMLYATIPSGNIVDIAKLYDELNPYESESWIRALANGNKQNLHDLIQFVKLDKEENL